MFQQSAQRRSIPGVLFIEDFDEVEADQPSSPSAVIDGTVGREVAETTALTVAMVSQEEVERLRSSAFAEGLAEGIRSAETGLASQRVAILQRLDDLMAHAADDMRATVQRDTELIAKTALSLLVECFPAFCARVGGGETLKLLRSLLPSVVDEPKLTVTVCESLAEVVREELATLGERNPQIVVRTGDLLPGDLRLTWQSGMACRDVRLLRSQMLSRLSDFGLLQAAEETVA